MPGDALVPGGPSGRRAAAIVALGFVAMLASSSGQSFWLSLFVDDMIVDTGLSRAGFSAVYAVATVCSAFMVVIVGTLFDRRGAALTWLVVAVGLAVGGLLMSVAAGAAVAILGLALLRAFGQGSFPLVGTLLVAGTFDAWRGRALSLATMGMTLAAAILPPVAAALIGAYGWRGALQISAVAVVCLVAPLALVVRWAIGPRGRGARPERSPSPGRARRAFAAASARARRFPWRNGGAILLVTIAAAPMVSTGAVFHATSLLAGSGLGLGEAAVALSVMAVTGALGAVLGGVLVDRVGVRASLVAMNAVLAAGITLLLVATPVGAYAAFALLGVAIGLNGTASGAAWGHTYGIERLGELQGVGEAARIGGAALGPLPLALALSLTGSYDAGVLVLAGLAFACALLGFRMPRARAAPAPTA
jgi:MFS family permease